MKNAFMLGLGLGAIAGAYLYKNCTRVKEVYDTAETNVQDKINECKEDIARKRAQNG